MIKKIPTVREASTILEDFIPGTVLDGIKRGTLISVRTALVAVEQALKESAEILGPEQYLKGYSDGYAGALDTVMKNIKVLLNAVDNLQA